MNQTIKKRHSEHTYYSEEARKGARHAGDVAGSILQLGLLVCAPQELDAHITYDWAASSPTNADPHRPAGSRKAEVL